MIAGQQFQEDCPKQECPPLSVIDHANSWRYPERSYMEILQVMHLEAFLTWWSIIIPDWTKLPRYLMRKITQLFEKLRYKEVPVEEASTYFRYPEVDNISNL